MNPTLIRIAASTLLATSLADAQAVSPASREAFEGTASTSYPLGRHDGRFQQLHADLPTSLTTITGHAFRRDAISTRDSLAGFSVDMEVQVSIAATTPDTASATFALNRGTNPITVLPRTTVTFPATSRPSIDPAPSFEYVIPYATPFTFPAGSVLCVETIIYGNTTASGSDRNHSLLLDAQALRTDGQSDQSGFRFGDGCASVSGGGDHYGRFVLARDANGAVALDIESRDGAPTPDPTQPTATILTLSTQTTAMAWPWLPNCTHYVPFEIVLNLASVSDTAGDLNETLAGFEVLPEGFRFAAQLISGNLASGDLTFADASWLTMPIPDPATLPAVRIAAASDHTATTGSISNSVAVTRFF